MKRALILTILVSFWVYGKAHADNPLDGNEYGVRLQCTIDEYKGKVPGKIRVNCADAGIYLLDEAGVRTKDALTQLDGKSINSRSEIPENGNQILIDATRIHMCKDDEEGKDCKLPNHLVTSPCVSLGVSTIRVDPNRVTGCSEVTEALDGKIKLGKSKPISSLSAGFCQMRIKCQDSSPSNSFGQLIVCRKPEGEGVGSRDQFQCPTAVECMRDKTFLLKRQDRKLLKTYPVSAGSAILIFNSKSSAKVKTGLCITNGRVSETKDGVCPPILSSMHTSPEEIKAEDERRSCIVTSQFDEMDPKKYSYPTTSYKDSQSGYDTNSKTVK